MSPWKRRFLFGLILVAMLVIGVFGLSVYFLEFLVDWLWFSAVDYEQFFWLRILYRYIIFLGVVLVFTSIFFLNFWVASRFVGSRGAGAKDLVKARGPYPELIKMVRSGSLKVYAPLALVMSIFIALPLFQQWEAFLFYIFGPSAGVGDPVYGRDIGYYLFVFPIHLLLQKRLLMLFLILLAASALLYWLERRLLAEGRSALPRGARIHLSLLVLITFLLFGWGYFLERYQLLYSANHLPLWFGPGYTEMRVILPLIWIILLFVAATALFATYWFHTRKGLIPTVVFAVLLVAAIGLRYSPILPNLVQKYIVEPNEFSTERPHIVRSIEATLRAYNLSDVETFEYPVESMPQKISVADVTENLRNIPVWDRELLEDVYEELQGIRPYYDFSSVDVDRYTVAGRYQQVNLAGRELNLNRLPPYVRNWINSHLQYTHGYGLVMTPAAQSGEEFMIWFVQDIPPQSDYNLNLKEPAIYYGEEEYDYVIAPNENGELDYPYGTANVFTNYKGEGGVSLSNVFAKFLFSMYFKNKNILFTAQTSDASQILFRRNIVERIKTITPFLRLDRDPYLVVTSTRLYWIQDAYTTSGLYPYAAPYHEDRNYIRNSVKIVVDAYDGSVNYYIADPSDPIVQAYDRIYPGLLKPLDQMPAELKLHIRYPKDIFRVQMEIYRKYHQTDPEVFYREEDIWEFAEFSSAPEASVFSQKAITPEMEPYYLTLDLIERGRQEFLLLLPMSPKNRSNLRSLMIAGCDPAHYGKIYSYNFPKGLLVYGPSQINTLIDQDTVIAEQFTLWGQVGSEVTRGKMIILPINNVMFYIQPVYLRAAKPLKIPELKRLIVSQGDVVVMAVSLEEAFRSLGVEVERKFQSQETRYPTFAPEEQGEAEQETPAPGAEPETPYPIPAPEQGVENGVPTGQTPYLDENRPQPQPAPPQ